MYALLGFTAMEGIFMSCWIPERRGSVSSSFRKIADVFLAGEGLPFSEVLSAERIERVFSRHGCLFGLHGIYSTAIVLWSFLSQVLRDGKEASCQAAVARIVGYCQRLGKDVPTRDTGDYCRARAKLSEAALRELTTEVAASLEDSSKVDWLWKGRHGKLVDGTTFTMPDTAGNQACYPQQPQQKPGLGQPIARLVVVLSLATACVMDAAIGPYAGKETGETALLRTLLKAFVRGDIAVMDRYYCSFMMIALLYSRGIDVCARRHHMRHADFRRGKRLGKYDHLIEWVRPARPQWMDEATYAQIPKRLELREVRYSIVVPGRRTHTIDVITTLTDCREHSKAEIAELYGFRWNAELDLRSLKTTLNLEHVRCKSPEMVRRELWTTLLGYNLIRTVAANAASIHGSKPRQISFTSTTQYVLGSWMMLSCGAVPVSAVDEYFRVILSQIAACKVANRPGRIEPRAVKRRPKNQKLLQKTREELRRELQKQGTKSK